MRLFLPINILIMCAVLPAFLVHAATPPTPQLTKSDKPLVDLGSELGGPAKVNKTTPPKTKVSSPQAPVQTPVSSSPEPAVKELSKTVIKPVKHEEKVHWGYVGEEGPQHWGDLSAENIQCKVGKNQSPIDLRDTQALGTTGMDELEIYYQEVPLKVINNGHTLQVNYPLGSYIKLGERRYELMHLQFHTPSEHMKEGFQYPMEMQVVHKDGDGNHVVIAVIFQEGEENEVLQDLLNNLPKEINKQEIRRYVSINPAMFIPGDTRFYKYSGSLTTPPCTEGVYWMVFKRPVEASAEQIELMNQVMGNNARPVQERNSRSVLKSWSENLTEPPMYEYY